MEIPVKIMISNRHVHLTEETYYKLFDEELTKYKDLNQIGQFAANQKLTVRTAAGEFENVRIVGPFRSYNQIEIAASDARKLKINPPVRRSGEVEGAAEVELVTPKATIKLANCIIANRHVHFNPKQAEELGIRHKDNLELQIDGIKRGTIDLEASVTDSGYFEVHLDVDDANAFLLENGTEATLII